MRFVAFPIKALMECMSYDTSQNILKGVERVRVHIAGRSLNP